MTKELSLGFTTKETNLWFALRSEYKRVIGCC